MEEEAKHISILLVDNHLYLLAVKLVFDQYHLNRIQMQWHQQLAELD